MRDIKEERRNLEKQLREMGRQVDLMTIKIRAYLADRQQNPHPRHEEFIARVQSFNIRSGLSTKQLDTLLDSLQWKVHYASQAWRQLWENAENAKRMEAQAGRSYPEEGGKPAEPEKGKGSMYSVDKLWEVQQERLQALGSDSPETKGEFLKRIKKEYGQLASDRKRDEEITMTFDEQAGRCVLEKKKKN
ncbi:MAG: hypothetical protein GXP53_08655 [Deltaproteobacteria bacterium]|nr:hypothetical protein [Deltaproteobacteria bacterium]